MTFSPRGFSKLQDLSLFDLDKLKNLHVEEGTLPNLKELSIVECIELEMLPDGLKHVTTLQELTLEMPKQFNDRVQVDGGEDWYKIKHVPYITTLNSEIRIEGRART
uniref:Uncharacterized protein n=1 Tax=Nelumbo nucifera TaxID=4432 RepID=A0A822Y5N3_NELNU|nr:TPA_asm: hypothetical protein HUJ06_026382 [Nelumbo nucifera]